jgi:dihydroorotate dehydrogenase electron transfer subunit
MIFLAESLQNDNRFEVLVMMGSEVPFPFELSKAGISVSRVPPTASYGVTLLEEWGTPSRVASKAGYEGCFQGFVTELARIWLSKLSAQELQKVQLLGCGPTDMLKATTVLAKNFDLPCQLALEEYMACGVGGCAGCTVLLHTPQGPTMKRVCVDGPVFDAYQIY